MESHLSVFSVLSLKTGKMASTVRDVAVSKALLDRQAEAAVLDGYVTQTPSAQNAIDVLPGWNMVLPSAAGVVAGPGYYFNDGRILWAIGQFDGIRGHNILELGPLEAAQPVV